MKIALGQMNVVQGAIAHNLNTMKNMIDQAKNEKVDLIVFPEMCISGYLLQDKWLDPEFCETLENANETIKSWSKDIGIIYGNISTYPLDKVIKGRDGRSVRFNCAHFCRDQKWVKTLNDELEGRIIKHLNPDYRIFDDSRYFLSGIEASLYNQQPVGSYLSPFIFEIDGKEMKIAIEVCEDLWSDEYSIDVTSNYINQGIDLIVNISASLWTKNKEVARQKQVLNHAQKHGDQFVPLIYVNNCGMQNSGKTIAVFDGYSTFYNKKGEVQACCNDDFKEECLILDMEDSNSLVVNEHKVLNALLTAIMEMDKQVFNSSVKWIIGLSGGLDSTINAALLTMALGNDRIIGYNLASQYNSDTTKNNAHILANKLGIELRVGSIEKLTEATISTIQEYGYTEEYGSLVYENIQARLRGHLLSTFSSIEKGVVINNGNKVEVALGYCTLYGDAIGAFSPLGDCTKVQLFEISKQINDIYQDEIIPYNLLPEINEGKIEWLMPPSAELKDAQLDPMKWFYHDWLIEKLLQYPSFGIEDIMQSYLDNTIYDTQIGQWIKYYGLDDPSAFIKDIEWVLNTMSNNLFKRFQMPPIVMITSGSFGNDFRESQFKADQSERFIQLKEEILKKV